MALRNFTNPNTPERQAIKRNMEVTAEITKLSELEIKTWLEEWVTHSELRAGKWVKWEFIPWELIDSLRKTKYGELPPVISNVYA